MLPAVRARIGKWVFLVYQARVPGEVCEASYRGGCNAHTKNHASIEGDGHQWVSGSAHRLGSPPTACRDYFQCRTAMTLHELRAHILLWCCQWVPISHLR